jgi:membrane-associated PAP2 superfamily phosphatase
MNKTSFTPNVTEHPWRHALIWLVLAFGITLGWDALAWDMSVSRFFGTAQGFALTEHPLWGKGFYRAQRALAWLSLFGLIWLCWWPIGPFVRMQRAERIAMVCTALMAIFVIQYFKRKSLTSCPWSLQEFGGVAQYVSHWMRGVRDGASGRCFPAGHASGALCFLAVPVFMLWHNKRWAYGLLAAVLLAGGLWGGTQLIRGAHYVSHTLWTTAICLVVVLVLRAIWFGLQRFRFKQTKA